ncbi:MAG TPA: erythritol/L-threitol dehydrogenase, partial [Limnochordia bacterium]|nr:erythritol/L-threitol dehydrogenase [Limnochordia bacterium]
QLMRKEADVYGSRNSTRMFPRALEVLAGGHIDVETMITHRMSLSDARAALELMKDPKAGAIKIVLRP